MTKPNPCVTLGTRPWRCMGE